MNNLHIDLNDILIKDLSLSPAAFDGQVVVVTGAGRGIGLEVARAFALLGARVVIAELAQTGREVERRIRAEGGQALFVQTDVSDPDSVAHLAQVVRDTYGPADVLVNNAIFISESAAVEMPVETWDRTIRVNLRGTFLTCQAFLPNMLARQCGTVINMVSTDAMPGLSAYIASKQGITGFSQSLAQEVGPSGVRVIPFAPGMVDTPGLRGVAPGLSPRLGLQPEQFLSLSLHSAYDGLMPAEHAAAATVYLALHLADEFHGQVINGYEVLERAGFLKVADEPSIPTGQPEEAQPSAMHTASRLELLQKLSCILAETEAEFGGMPVFVRPMARQGFKSKSGHSLADWQRLVAALEDGKTPANLADQLDKLARYYREVPKELARFTKDEEMLRQVTKISSDRVNVIDQLKRR